jgi:hypothetical protein
MVTMEQLSLIIAQIVHHFGMALTVYHVYCPVTGTMIPIGVRFALQELTTM